MSKKIHVAIDGNEANVRQRVGSNVYAFEILTGLEYLTQGLDAEVTVLLADPPLKDLPKPRIGWSYQIIKPHFLWTQIALPLYLYTHQIEYDVLFTPGHYAPRRSAIPYVSSVMDLGYLKFPEQFKKRDLWQLTEWTHYSVAQAAKVIAISDFTKKDIVKNYHKPAEDVIVAYPSVDSNVHPVYKTQVEKVQQKYKLQEPYILYVGTLQPRKNLVKLIEAFEVTNQMLAENQTSDNFKSPFELRHTIPYKKVRLVIAGRIGWLADEILNRINDSPYKDQIILTDYIDSQTKNALYQGAAVSVLIGTYEGFGIPPLESMVIGTVPVVANATSLPEVVGAAGILVDPDDSHSIAHGLISGLLLGAKARAKLRREMRKQLTQFDWHISSQIIWDTLVDVARTRRK